MTTNARPADRLRELIQEQGWTLAALSSAAGLGKGAVSDLLNHPDRHPREKTLRALAGALSVDYAYLAGRMDRPHPATDLAEGVPCGRDILTDGLDNLIGSSGGRLRAFHRAGNAGGETVIIDTSQAGESGQTVLTDDAAGPAMRYLAEPYLIGTDASGATFHALRQPDTHILGRVLAVIRHF